MEVMRTLADLGAGFDCASKSEIKQVLNIGTQSPRPFPRREARVAPPCGSSRRWGRLGGSSRAYARKARGRRSSHPWVHSPWDSPYRCRVDPRNFAGVDPASVIYAHPCKQPSHLRYAKRVGVKKMTFDSEDELIKLSKEYPEAELYLRIHTDDTHSISRLGLKFGAKMGQIAALVRLAQDLKLNLVGLSYHVGSGNYRVASFAEAVQNARAVYDLALSLGTKL
jgi:diaminopimelate decarboxylase